MVSFDSFTVRLLVSSEAEMLTRLARQAFTDAYAAVTRTEDLQSHLDANFRTDLQRAELEKPQGFALLASAADDTPAGYAQLCPGPSPHGVKDQAPMQLQRFYLLKPYWGSGAADLLMQRCLAEAAGRGYRSVWLSCWEKNARALAFYRKWEFAPAGKAPFRVGSDLQTDVILARQLP